MTTSPEALREAVERVASSVAAAKWPNLKGCDVYPEDLTLVLSALQEAREALGPFAAAMPGFDAMAAYEGAPMADDDIVVLSHGFGSLKPEYDVSFCDFRRAAEAYRALSPGGADD